MYYTGTTTEWIGRVCGENGEEQQSWQQVAESRPVLGFATETRHTAVHGVLRDDDYRIKLGSHNHMLL